MNGKMPQQYELIKDYQDACEHMINEFNHVGVSHNWYKS